MIKDIAETIEKLTRVRMKALSEAFHLIKDFSLTERDYIVFASSSLEKLIIDVSQKAQEEPPPSQEIISKVIEAYKVEFKVREGANNN